MSALAAAAEPALMNTISALFARTRLLPTGWARDVLLQWDAAGSLSAVLPDSQPPAGVSAAGPVLPGMPNLHSHAFQRAFAGLTEYRGAGAGQFLELARR